MRDEAIQLVADFLKEKELDIEAKARLRSWGLFHEAVYKNNIELVKLLYHMGADINLSAGMNKNTPLHLAASKNCLAIAKWLIEHGADVNSKALHGTKPLRCSASKDMDELLIKHGATR